MISSETPDKLADIIRDTWPNLFRSPRDYVPPSLWYNKKTTITDKSNNEKL